jgi:hypothetical protein
VNPVGIWKMVHLVAAFYFVGGLVVAEWNGRAMRASPDWAVRAALADVVRNALGVGDLIALLVAGIAGNMLAVSLGYSMAGDRWLHVSNGVWVLTVVVLLALSIPATSSLAKIARRAAGAGSPDGWGSAMVRFRIGNVLLTLLWLGMLGLMVFRWRS